MRIGKQQKMPICIWKEMLSFKYAEDYSIRVSYLQAVFGLLAWRAKTVHDK